MPVRTAAPIWISHGGEKHRLAPATGTTSCGMQLRAPYPGCNRTDPICKGCMRAMRPAAKQ